MEMTERVPYMYITPSYANLGTMNFYFGLDLVFQISTGRINSNIADLVEYYKGKIDYLLNDEEAIDNDYSDAIKYYEERIKELEKLKVIIDMMILNNPEGKRVLLTYLNPQK